jgi:hypothetical protein
MPQITAIMQAFFLFFIGDLGGLNFLMRLYLILDVFSRCNYYLVILFLILYSALLLLFHWCFLSYSNVSLLCSKTKHMDIEILVLTCSLSWKEGIYSVCIDYCPSQFDKVRYNNILPM